MNKVLSAFTILLFLSCNESPQAQTYVGEMLYRNTYEYIKVVCKNDTCLFSIPYLDDAKKYPINGDMASTSWEIQRGIEHWTFETSQEEGRIAGKLELPTGTQQVQLWEQRKPIETNRLSMFTGTYEDELKRKVIIYAQHDYLVSQRH